MFSRTAARAVHATLPNAFRDIRYVFGPSGLKDYGSAALRRKICCVLTSGHPGRNFIWDNLRMTDVECYWRTLLEKYSELLDFEPNRGEEYVEVVE